MATEFTPIFLFVLVAIGMSVSMIIATHLIGPKQSSAVKQMPYESGMDPVGDARQRFDVRYYLVAIVFLLFDVELLYLYPWAVAQWSADTPVATASATPGADGLETAANPVNASSAGIPADFRNLVFGEILVFVAILAAAYAYAWKKGVFEWR